MPSENSGNADANRAAFLKRKTAVIYTRVERLADSISRFAKFSFDESVLYVGLELIDDILKCSTSSKNRILCEI